MPCQSNYKRRFLPLFFPTLIILSGFLRGSFSSPEPFDPPSNPSPRLNPSDSKMIQDLTTSGGGGSNGGNSSTETPTIVRNFRQAAGIANVFRCASTDELGAIASIADARIKIASPTDQFVWKHAGCILDLRSSNERNELHAQNWMTNAPGPTLRVIEDHQDYTPSFNDNSHPHNHRDDERVVVRVNVLSPNQVLSYIEASWLDAVKKARAGRFRRVGDEKGLHELLIDELNKRGLAGLNEIILETGKTSLCKALRTITLFLEGHPNSSVLIHCVQGKDRTGMLVMLLQSILGVTDETIVEDYCLSNIMLEGQMQYSSAAADQIRRPGRIDRNFLTGANRPAMETTLSFLRNKYGSVSPGYLDAIGFDRSWRARLSIVLNTQLSRL